MEIEETCKGGTGKKQFATQQEIWNQIKIRNEQSVLKNPDGETLINLPQLNVISPIAQLKSDEVGRADSKPKLEFKKNDEP